MFQFCHFSTLRTKLVNAIKSYFTTSQTTFIFSTAEFALPRLYAWFFRKLIFLVGHIPLKSSCCSPEIWLRYKNRLMRCKAAIKQSCERCQKESRRYHFPGNHRFNSSMVCHFEAFSSQVVRVDFCSHYEEHPSRTEVFLIREQNQLWLYKNRFFDRTG